MGLFFGLLTCLLRCVNTCGCVFQEVTDFTTDRQLNFFDYTIVSQSKSLLLSKKCYSPFSNISASLRGGTKRSPDAYALTSMVRISRTRAVMQCLHRASWCDLYPLYRPPLYHSFHTSDSAGICLEDLRCCIQKERLSSFSQ